MLLRHQFQLCSFSEVYCVVCYDFHQLTVEIGKHPPWWVDNIIFLAHFHEEDVDPRYPR